MVWLRFRVASHQKWSSKQLLFCEDMVLSKKPNSLQVNIPNHHLFPCVILHYSTHSLFSIGVCGVGVVGVGVGIGVSVGVLIACH